MALSQRGVISGRPYRQRYGPYYGELAPSVLPGLYARKDEAARFEQQMGLERERLNLAEQAQQQAQQDARTANRIALAGLGANVLLAGKRYQGLSSPEASAYTTDRPTPVRTDALRPSGYGGQHQAGYENQTWWNRTGEGFTQSLTSPTPYVAGLGGGLLGSQLGGQIAGKKHRKTGKVLGGAAGGAAAGYAGGGNWYDTIVGGVIGAGLGAII